MKKKVNKGGYAETDKFDRKQKRHSGERSHSSKNKLSIYDEFEDEDLMEYPLSFDDEEEE